MGKVERGGKEAENWEGKGEGKGRKGEREEGKGRKGEKEEGGEEGG